MLTTIGNTCSDNGCYLQDVQDHTHTPQVHFFAVSLLFEHFRGCDDPMRNENQSEVKEKTDQLERIGNEETIGDEEWVETNDRTNERQRTLENE